MALRPTALPAFGVFAIAARHQNLAHAAEELGLTASAVSHHVRSLEATLGVKLFQRHARGVALTVEGRSLADAANAALSDIDAVAAGLNKQVDSASQVRIAALHSLTYCWLIPRVSRFVQSHPDVLLSFETGTAITRFDHTGPDLAIRHGAGSWPGLTSIHVMDEHLFPAAPPTMRGLDRISEAADIPTLPLVTDLAHQGWREWLRAAGVRGVHLPEMHSFTDSTDAMQASIQGLGAILARSRIVEPYSRDGRLVRLPGPLVKARYGYYVVHPSHRRPSAATSIFIEWLRREAEHDQEYLPEVFVSPAISQPTASAKSSKRT
jgi:LysR family transcriptional regulator, glycine cleavage system transcriptional activator